MLRGAVQKHEKEHAPAKDLFDSSPPVVGSQGRSSQGVNPGYRKPLGPGSSNALNTVRGSQSQQRVQSGIKRTASGLAKALDGSFDDGPGTQHRPITLDGRSPPKGKSVRVSTNDFVDENDFDSDIDLDIEEPAVKKSSVQYPSLPQQRASAISAKPIVYPTLARQQQVQAPRVDVDASYDSPPARPPPGSSAPLPWSSSPAEHHAPVKKPSLSAFTYNPAGQAQHGQNGPPPPAPQAQPKTAKRRTLPWLTQDAPEENHIPQHSFSSKSKVSDASTATPSVKDEKKSMYPWNTSASAIKDQQRKHREETKKHIIKNEGDEESLSKAKSSRQRPAKVFLSEEQQHVLNLVIDQRKSVFFTGSAGTGKSVLMREIITSLRKKYEREPDRVAVTASTGLAACNVGGVTLHSFAGIGLGKEDAPELVRKIKKNQKAKHRWMRTKVLVVDEVSMVDGELSDKLENIARNIRNNGRPFGGIQLVITGDFFQLPPVPDNNGGKREARFAFDAATWNTTIEHTIGLHHVFRQKDPVFAGMLNEMREGRLRDSSIKAFQGLSRPLSVEHDLEATELFPTRNEVEQANHTRLHNLQGEVFPFEARDGGAIVDKPQRDRLLQNCMAPELINLKKGSQVMLIKNIDESLVNGSIGRVMGFMDEKKFDSYTTADEGFPLKEDGTIASTHEIAADEKVSNAPRDHMLMGVTANRKWPVVRFIIADGTSRDLLCQPESWKVELPNGEVQASRQQIPLILAWALSIHKAQGQTLERVKVDLGKVFEKGQAYVALSRATSMAGLQVLRFDPKKVNAHEKVRAFYSKLARFELQEKNKERMEKIDGQQQEKKKGGWKAGEYERMFVDDDM